MGFLSSGDTLSWEEAKNFAEYIREHGITQFLNIYNHSVHRKNDPPFWGDEVEYIVFTVDDKSKTTGISLRSHEILHELQEEERKDPLTATSLWRPEYGSFMIEGTPGQPYDQHLCTLLSVEESMKKRRKQAESVLQTNEIILSLTSFPLLGVGNYSTPPPAADWIQGTDPTTKSLFIHDQVINHHARFRTLSANIRKRRGKTVDINIPLFKDECTGAPQYGPTHFDHPEPQHLIPPPGAIPGHIYLDAMAFGMGCCCLQTTFQLSDISQARYIYDQFGTLTPIMLGLSAAAPIFRGYLADTDVRWNTISASVDDRNEQERGLKPLSESQHVIPKSRYSSFSLFISEDERLIDQTYNDIDAPHNLKAYDRLRKAGLDHRLSLHISHLFIRDPLVIYNDRIEIDDQHNSDHFENIQSTNWQTVRFKPPPPNSGIGWRVEFRSLEVQLTDFENAAFAIFVALLGRVIIHFDLDLYMPISKIDENMATSHRQEAVTREKFWFRRVGFPTDKSVSLFTINEIINGKEGEQVGLANLIRQYIEQQAGLDASDKEQLNRYIRLVMRRASGELITTASWIRKFVRAHPAYRRDSVVSPEINHDLLKNCLLISQGDMHVAELLG